MAEWTQDRVTFYRDLDVVEVDFSDLRMATADDADFIYDQLDGQFSRSGQNKWLFMVNYATAGSCPTPG